MARLHLASAHLQPRPGSRAARAILAMWLALPVLGKPTFLVFLAAVALLRDREGVRIKGLNALVGLSLVYAAYIVLRAVIAGPGAVEPLLDVLPLVIVTGLAAWAVRGPIIFDMARVFKGSVLVLFGVLILTLLEQAILGTLRPPLLLGNPFNLSPLLLLPILIASMDRYAPSQGWVWLGLLAICAGGFTLGAILYSRSLFMGFFVLLLLRLVFGWLEPGTPRKAVLRTLGVLAALGLTVLAVSQDPTASARYSVAVETVANEDSAPEWSTGFRLAMLQGGWEAFSERPIWGHGPQNRTSAAFAHMPETFTQIPLTHLHNDFLTHAVAGGIPAVLLLLALILFPVWVAWSLQGQAQPTSKTQLWEVSVLTSCILGGVAVANNILFVDISAFSTGLLLVFSTLLLHGLAHPTEATS